MPLVIEELKKSFEEKRVLTGVNCVLKDNGIYCLMGPSGMGKTTLLRILLGRETADSGSVTGIQSSEISAMFQEDRLIPTLSAIENVALVCPRKIRAGVLAKELARILPENCLNQPISQLSGGMKRRVALARAMHFPSKMVILDEPFTGLDQNTRREVISYLLDLRGERILLVATHGIQDAALLGAQTIRLEELQSDREVQARKQRAVLNREEILSRMRMFEGIAPNRCSAVVEKLGGYEKEYCEGEVIWRQYEHYLSMGIILSGSIQAEDISREETQIIQRFDAGCGFGEAVAFGRQNSWAEIRAMEPTRVLFLPTENFMKQKDDPEIVHVMVNLLGELSEKLNLLNLKNRFLSEPRLRSRILLYFSTLSADANGDRTIPFSQKDLAQYLNVNRSAINRELGRMRDEGIIQLDGHTVRLLQQPERR